MTQDARAGAATRRIAWLVVAALPVAAFTTSGPPWNWGFALVYLATAFFLEAAVRLKSAGLERFVHVVVLAGSAPLAVRTCFGMELGAVDVVHVMAVLVFSIGVGYLLADRIRPRFRSPNAV